MLFDLSIIIPSYNSGSRLRETLRTLHQGDAQVASVTEVIVVDDGSNDDTREIVADAVRTIANLRYIFRERDELSCRSRARNLGIQAALGQTLLFLDAGVLAGTGVLQAASKHGRERPDQVLMFKTLGLLAEEQGSGEAGFTERFVASLTSARINELMFDKGWRDEREAFARGLADPEHDLPAPWLLAWTCALSVCRDAAMSVGGFDTDYLGWGDEDVDFAARLAAHGLGFSWEGERVAIHIPHGSKKARSDEHLQSSALLHRKVSTRESEIFAHWRMGLATNVFSSRLERLQLARVAPPSRFAATDLPKRPDGLLICSGLQWSEQLIDLQPSVAVAHQQSLMPRLRNWWPKADVRCLLGIGLPYRDAEFVHAVIGDLVRLLPPELQRKYLSEIGRVAPTVLAIASTEDGHEYAFRRLAGWGWTPLVDLIELAANCGLNLESRTPLNNNSVLLCFRRG